MRWIAESNAWGCDRCRQLHPAQVPQPPPQYQQPPQQPQAAYVPQPVAGQPVPPVSQAKPKSGKGLLVVILLLVVGGGAAAAIFLLKGNGGSLGGEDSRDALVDKTLAALNAGDGAALLALAPDESKLTELNACGDKKKPDDATIERHRKQAREDADKLAAETKGKGLVVDKVTEGTGGATITPFAHSGDGSSGYCQDA